MTATEYLSLPVILGALLIIWAVAARRSPFDAIVIALAGLLLLSWAVRWQLDYQIASRIGIWPELILGLLGLIMLVRVFISGLGWPHRVGLGLAGCAVTLPLLVLIGLIALFSWGSAHHHERPPPANEVQANRS